MTNIEQQVAEVIDRAKHLQEFTVLRDEDEMILTGLIRYSVTHRPGTPYKIKVPAISQKEAETRVDEWIEEMRNYE